MIPKDMQAYRSHVLPALGIMSGVQLCYDIGSKIAKYYESSENIANNSEDDELEIINARQAALARTAMTLLCLYIHTYILRKGFNYLEKKPHSNSRIKTLLIASSSAPYLIRLFKEVIIQHEPSIPWKSIKNLSFTISAAIATDMIASHVLQLTSNPSKV